MHIKKGTSETVKNKNDNSAMKNESTNDKNKRKTEKQEKKESLSKEDISIENINASKQHKEENLEETNKITRNHEEGCDTAEETFIPAQQIKFKDCNCSNRCTEHVTKIQRKDLFDRFLNLSDLDQQNAFLRDNII